MLQGPDYKSNPYYMGHMELKVMALLSFNRISIHYKDLTLINLTRVWPMINSDSALYSICGASTNKGELLNIVAQPNMTEDERIKVG